MLGLYIELFGFCVPLGQAKIRGGTDGAEMNARGVKKTAAMKNVCGKSYILMPLAQGIMIPNSSRGRRMNGAMSLAFRYGSCCISGKNLRKRVSSMFRSPELRIRRWFRFEGSVLRRVAV